MTMFLQQLHTIKGRYRTSSYRRRERRTAPVVRSDTTGIHWGYGVLWGGLFGALRNRVPVIGSAAGLTYGTGLWLIGDELMMPILKLSPPSTDFPWQNHARAFTNHAAYGTTLWLTLETLSRLTDRVTG